MASNLPGIEESTINDIFVEVSEMEVLLDRDPLEFGPRRLNEKTSIARDHLTRCEKLFGQVSHWLQLYKRAHRAGQLEFDLAMQDMLANDPEVRAGRNFSDRNAIAVVKMKSEKEDLDQLQVIIQDLDAVMAVIKSKRADLKDVQNNLKSQRNLCQEEINLGARWGSKIHDGTARPVNNFDLSDTPVVDSVTMKDLQRLMSLSDELDMSSVEVPFVDPTPPAETVVTETVVPAPVEENPNKSLKVSDLPVSAPQGDIDDFLNEIDLTPPKPDTSKDVSIDDLLNSL